MNLNLKRENFVQLTPLIFGNTDLSVERVEELRVKKLGWTNDSDPESHANCGKKKVGQS